MAVSGKFKNSMKAQIFLGLLASGVILASTPSFAQSNRDMSNRLNRIENELETLGRAVYKGEQPPVGAYSGGTSAADAEVRIQQFESQIREMTGRLEEQDNQIRQLREQLEKLSADLDIRLSGTQDGGSGGSFSNDSTGGSFTNNPIRSTNTGGGTERGITPPPGDESGNGYQWNSGSSSMTDGQLGTLTDSGAGAAAGADSAASLYENAFSLLKGAQYNEAEKEFRSFLSQYPGHPLTATRHTGSAKHITCVASLKKQPRLLPKGTRQIRKARKPPITC
jgi:TolA-binding protein